MLIAMLAAAGLLLLQGIGAEAPGFAFSLPGLPARAWSGAPSATENWLKANETYNAELMWSTLSEEARERYRSRGGTVQTLQGQMEQAKQAGSTMEQFTYIGGQSLPDGTSMHFYLVVSRGPMSRGEAEYVPYVFTLDKSGKIARVQ